MRTEVSGAKVSDRIEVVEALLRQVDALVIGGAMANTFLAAQGRNMQASRIEGDKLPLARTILEKAEARGVEVILPSDVVVAKALEATEGQTVPVTAVPEGTMALDVGPATVQAIKKRFAGARTIFWNGPMGLFENHAFSAGTFGVARAGDRFSKRGLGRKGGGAQATYRPSTGQDALCPPSLDVRTEVRVASVSVSGAESYAHLVNIAASASTSMCFPPGPCAPRSSALARVESSPRDP